MTFSQKESINNHLKLREKRKKNLLPNNLNMVHYLEREKKSSGGHHWDKWQISNSECELHSSIVSKLDFLIIIRKVVIV